MAASRKRRATSPPSKDAPAAGGVPQTTTPTTAPTRPNRAATKRRYTSTDFQGYKDEDIEADFTDSSDVQEDEDGTLHSSKKRKTSHAAPKRKPAQKSFPFLRLPAEIRNLIYSYALTDTPILLASKTKASRRVTQLAVWTECEPEDRYRFPSLSPRLLATNRQIYQEAAPFLYSQPLTFVDTYALYSFLGRIGSARVLVENVVLTAWGYRGAVKSANHSAFTMLAGCTNLKRLWLYCHVYSRYCGLQLAKRFYREAHNWLEAVGRHKGHRAAGIDLIEFGDRGKLTEAWESGWFVALKQPDRAEWLDRDVKKQFQSQLRELLGASEQAEKKDVEADGEADGEEDEEKC